MIPVTSSAGEVLVACVIVGPLLGLNLVIYPTYVKLMCNKNTARASQRAVCLAITDFVILSIDAYSGLIVHNQSPEDTALWFARPQRWQGVSIVFLFVSNYILGDAIMAWRCYVVLGRNRPVGLLLLVLVLAACACGYSTVEHIARLSGGQSIAAVASQTLVQYSLSLVIQLLATSLIVWKIAPKTAWTSLGASSTRFAILWTVVESGALLTAATAAILTLYLVDQNGTVVMGAVIAQISFTVPTSIIIRSTLSLSGSERDIKWLTLPKFRSDAAGSSSDVEAQPIEIIRPRDMTTSQSTLTEPVDTSASNGEAVSVAGHDEPSL